MTAPNVNDGDFGFWPVSPRGWACNTSIRLDNPGLRVGSRADRGLPFDSLKRPKVVS